MKNAVSIVACLAIGLQGCATVVRGPNVDFTVVSSPPGAAVTTNLQTNAYAREVRAAEKRDRAVKGGITPYHSCPETPCTFEVSRRANFTVTLTHEGYHPATVEITSGYGGGGAAGSVAGAGISAAGAYVVSYSVFAASYTAVAALMSAVTLGAVSSTAAAGAGSAASSAASTAAAGVGAAFLAVDFASGAMKSVRPNPLAVVMVPDTKPVPVGEDIFVDDAETLETVRREIQEGPVLEQGVEPVPAE